MPVITAQPPTVPAYYLPSDIKRVFKALLPSIAISDERHGTHTPTPTLLLIIAAASELGVQAGDLVDESGD